MTSCPCSPAAGTSVRFHGDVVLVRCPAHEQQSWFVDGQRTRREDVLPVLRALFTDRRGERRDDRPAARRRHVVRRPEPVVHDLAPEAGDDERLTALLRSRGLSGSWAVA